MGTLAGPYGRPREPPGDVFNRLGSISGLSFSDFESFLQCSSRYGLHQCCVLFIFTIVLLVKVCIHCLFHLYGAFGLHVDSSILKVFVGKRKLRAFLMSANSYFFVN